MPRKPRRALNDATPSPNTASQIHCLSEHPRTRSAGEDRAYRFYFFNTNNRLVSLRTALRFLCRA